MSAMGDGERVVLMSLQHLQLFAARLPGGSKLENRAIFRNPTLSKGTGGYT